MSEKKVKHVLCAVRGGRESRDTVTRAIDLALETGARLTFFHAIDAEFLGHATVGRLSVVYQELHEMREFAMLILCDRAQRRGVSEVGYEVREGDIKAELRQCADETDAEVLVLGRPVRSPGSNVFTPDEFDELVTFLDAETDRRVVQVNATNTPP
ncbi:MAG: universal stress protein [Chloroflexi bacterium]|nr:universal stress protein [Chloroflexota bacterium]MBU1750098.1 universal stress protein [Chloroflexota bacterium]